MNVTELNAQNVSQIRLLGNQGALAMMMKLIVGLAVKVAQITTGIRAWLVILLNALSAALTLLRARTAVNAALVSLLKIQAA